VCVCVCACVRVCVCLLTYLLIVFTARRYTLALLGASCFASHATVHKNTTLPLFPETLGTSWWNPFHFILNGSKDMVCWQTYNFFRPPWFCVEWDAKTTTQSIVRELLKTVLFARSNSSRKYNISLKVVSHIVLLTYLTYLLTRRGCATASDSVNHANQRCAEMTLAVRIPSIPTKSFPFPPISSQTSHSHSYFAPAPPFPFPPTPVSIISRNIYNCNTWNSKIENCVGL